MHVHRKFAAAMVSSAALIVGGLAFVSAPLIASAHEIVSITGTVDCQGNYSISPVGNVFGNTDLVVQLGGVTISDAVTGQTSSNGNDPNATYGPFTGTGATVGEAIASYPSDNTDAGSTGVLVLSVESCSTPTATPTPSIPTATEDCNGITFSGGDADEYALVFDSSNSQVGNTGVNWVNNPIALSAGDYTYVVDDFAGDTVVSATEFIIVTCPVQETLGYTTTCAVPGTAQGGSLIITFAGDTLPTEMSVDGGSSFAITSNPFTSGPYTVGAHTFVVPGIQSVNENGWPFTISACEVSTPTPTPTPVSTPTPTPTPTPVVPTPTPPTNPPTPLTGADASANIGIGAPLIGLGAALAAASIWFAARIRREDI